MIDEKRQMQRKFSFYVQAKETNLRQLVQQ